MGKQKESTLREEQEKKEGKPIITNDVAANRLQQDQQIATTSDAESTEAASSSFNKKEVKGKGAELKTEKVADLLTGSSNTAGMGIAASGRSVSGTMGGVLGANNSTPQAQQSRSNSRTGKKLDRTATKLNYTPSEQAVLVVDESKPLADAAGDDQGYNGTYRNVNARSQKNVGAVPADLLYQRSVDFIKKDELYFAEGQMNFQTGDDTSAYYPSTTIDVSKFNEDGTSPVIPVKYHLGNFLHRNFHFKFDSNGKVVQFYADVENITKSDLTQEDANCSSAHRLIKSNVAELDRMAMDAKAGDEKAEIWSCLPRAISEPTKAAALMSSFEAETGAYVHMAYSKATTNMAFQLNRGPKDGLDEVTPAIEELVGWRSKYNDSTSLGNAFGNVLDKEYIFNKTAYRAGDPSIMIEAYDSIAKYKNKADLLLQPRGFRMHLQTADNNMNPLRVPREYANVFAATEAYSTIDHEYDPLLPICMTDKCNLILAHNLNETSAFDKDRIVHVGLELEYKASGTAFTFVNKKLLDYKFLQATDYKKVALCYKKLNTEESTGALVLSYDSSNNKYTYSAKSTGTGTKKVEMDIILVTEVDSSNNLVVPTGYTSAGTITVSSLESDVTIDTFKATGDDEVVSLVQTFDTDTLYAYQGAPYVYKYSDLRNDYIMEVKHPLVDGIIAYFDNSIGMKFRTLLDQADYTLPLIFSTMHMTAAQLIICAATPWIARVRENAFKDVIYYEDNIHEYPYSKLTSLKEVPFKNYINFEYSDYDTPLGTKIMNPVQSMRWVMPEFFWKIADESYVLPWYFNENDLDANGNVNEDAANMSMPSIRSGIRLGLLDNFYGMSEKDIRLSLDRMTKYFLKHSDITNFYAYKYGRTTDGQILAILDSDKIFSVYDILSCPRELGLVMDAPLGVLTIDPSDDKLKDLTDDGTATSYSIRVYTNKTNNTEHPEILAASGVNIARGANYVQKWYQITANNATENTDVIGLVFGMGDDTPDYSPFAVLGTGASAQLETAVTSYQRSLHTRLQFLPFIISPFDANFTGYQAYDIYDIGYMFGLCGFRASDYRESVYNREKRVVNEGLLFVSDPWIEDSPIINGAAKSTGIKMSVGYEVK